ncbi:MAG: hypothetical protein II297_07010 [Clostridia bacterium]|nr:hypothetical protein [Clostridia bacterium]
MDKKLAVKNIIYLTIEVNLTTTDHPLFLWLKKAQRKSLAKRNADKEFRRCDGEKACAAFTRASF